MKKGNSLMDERLLKELGRSLGSKSHHEDLELLIFVTDLDSLEIRFTNLLAAHYLTLPNENLFRRKVENSFQKIVHPEDYQDFILHLKSLQNMPEGAVEEITVRIKTRSRATKKFLFVHRLYQAESNQRRSVIGVAREVSVSGKDHRRTARHPHLKKALLKSQNKNRSLLNNIEEGFCIIDVLFDAQKTPVDYVFLETNTAFERRVKLGNVLERTMKEISPEHEKDWFEIYGRIAIDRESLKFRSYAKNLSQTWFDVNAFPIGDDDEGHVGILLSDVTEDVLQKEKLNNYSSPEENAATKSSGLRENYKLLKTIFDKTRVGIAVLQPVYEKNGDLVDFIYVRANNCITETYRKNVVGQSYLKINPNAADTGVFSTFKRAMFSGISENIEVKKALNNEKNWYRITARREDGLLITSLEDISRRKAKSNRLKENIRFKKQIAETSPDIIMILNLQQENVRYINRDMASHPGMRKKDIDGMPLSGIIPFIHPYDRDKAIDFHKKITKATDKEILEIEFRLKTKDEHWEWFSARGKVFMRNRESDVCEYILLLRNIEQQKKTQQALLQAEKLSIKGEVARTLAHELRNPMASIGMAADILSKKIKREENVELENYLGVIRRSTSILNKLVTDLLNSSNYSPFSPVKCCLAETLENALKAAGDRIYLIGIKVEKKYDGHYFILADQEKLKIALLNIIVNASEAMNPDEGVLNLKIDRKAQDYELTIKDNGCGMEKPQLEKLFDAFYTGKPHGVGVGLSSVKSILEEHNAKILVKSKLNKGTSFHLTFHSYETFERT